MTPRNPFSTGIVRIAPLIACAGSLLIGGILGGCEDSSARDRSAAQAKIAQARQNLATISYPSYDATAEELDAAKGKLDGVVRDVSGLNVDDASLIAGRNIIAAAALREKAGLDLAAAEVIEHQNRSTRVGLHAKVDAALMLNSLGEGRTSVSTEPSQAMLDAQIAEAKDEASKVSVRVSELQGPLTEGDARNTADSQEAARLRQESEAQLRKANELGPADGFDAHEKAITLRRQADRLEFAASQRELDLIESRAEHKDASDRAKSLQERIALLEAARAEVSKVGDARENDATATKKQVTLLAGEIEAGIGELNNISAEALAPHYQTALESIEKGASQARTAGQQIKGEVSSAAKVMTARLLELEARTHWAKAHGLADQRDLLQRLVDTKGAFEAAPRYAEQLQQINTEHAAEVEAAKASLTSAQEALGSASGRGEVEAFQRSIEVASSALSGAPASSSGLALTLPTGDENQGAAPTSAGAAAPQGFESPEALLEFLRSNIASGTNPAQQLTAFLNVAHASTPQAKAALKVIAGMSDAMTELGSALTEKFGDASAAGEDMDLNITADSLSAENITSRTDDKVVVSYTESTGKADSITLVKVDEKWYLSADEFKKEDQQAMVMMAAMLPGMKKAAKDVATRIRAGEFTTAADAMQAFQQAMMEGMGFGGTPGGAGGGAAK